MKTKAALVTIKSKYGLTRIDLEMLLSIQNNTCPICKEEFIDYKFTIDHDHKNGKFRSLLCNNCNCGLGQFCDNKEIINSAIGYLNKYKNVN